MVLVVVVFPVLLVPVVLDRTAVAKSVWVSRGELRQLLAVVVVVPVEMVSMGEQCCR